MANQSAIEWTDATWNFLKGCTPVSAGCLNCYAAGVAHQKQNHPNPKVSAQFAGLTVLKRASEGQRAVFNGRINVVEHLIEAPLRWKEPKRIFVNSLSDLFHPDVPVEVIDRAFAVMALCPQHTFQILTKRPERMAAYLSRPGLVRSVCEVAHQAHRASCKLSGPEFSAANTRRFNAHMKRWWEHVGRLTAWTVSGGIASETFVRGEPGREYPSYLNWPLPNVWVGTSVEDQAAADERIPHLLRAPAAVHFLSCEPLLGDVDLDSLDCWPRFDHRPSYGFYRAAFGGDGMPIRLRDGIDWVIAGGESGAHARPMHPSWVTSLRDQCSDAGVPFHFKQWGEWKPINQMRESEWDRLYYPAPETDPEALRQCRVSTVQLQYDGEEGFRGTARRPSMMMFRVGKKPAGRELDGRTWDEFPPTAAGAQGSHE